MKWSLCKTEQLFLENIFYELKLAIAIIENYFCKQFSHIEMCFRKWKLFSENGFVWMKGSLCKTEQLCLENRFYELKLAIAIIDNYFCKQFSHIEMCFRKWQLFSENNFKIENYSCKQFRLIEVCFKNWKFFV